EEASKAPLIIYDPRLPKQSGGKVSEAVTGNVDMAATIFALSGVPAPEGIDGRSLLPLLSNRAGRVRDWLPLFNFWGQQSAQSMAVVSSDWKYIYWYYGGGAKKSSTDDGLKPTEELFHLAKDRIEMANVAVDTQFTAQLAAARSAYDAELATMKAKVIQGHGHEPYPVLFDRTSSWATKEPLLQLTTGKGGGEEEGSAKLESNKREERKRKEALKRGSSKPTTPVGGMISRGSPARVPLPE
ncbi:MAG: sulfatase/phosphatase domain-containing protein, partial [Thermoguttaceae bacterium]